MASVSNTLGIDSGRIQSHKIPTVELTYRDTIEFQAGPERTLIVIPHADELFGTAEWYLVLDLDANAKSQQLTVDKQLPAGSEPVAYHYGVYCEGDADFAEGYASSPVLLIGPP